MIIYHCSADVVPGRGQFQECWSRTLFYVQVVPQNANGAHFFAADTAPLIHDCQLIERTYIFLSR